MADLYSLFIAMEHLEKAYVRDAISHEELVACWRSLKRREDAIDACRRCSQIPEDVFQAARTVQDRLESVTGRIAGAN